MHFKYFLLSLLILFSITTQAQKRVSGLVLSDQGTFITQGMISVIDPASNAIIAYTRINEQGQYNLSYKSELPQLLIKASAMNFKIHELSFETKPEQVIDFDLESETTMLEEIIVKASIITQHNDTLVFDLNSFAGQNDRVLEDVIKKMPGLKIGEGGQILYQDKPINKFYVNGKDLMGGSYSQITKALPNAHVSKLEVLENHQPIRMLEDKIASEDPAINIVLKKGISASGSAKIGAGIAPGIYNASVSPMLFTENLQYLFNLEANNNGKDVNSKLRNFSIGSRFSNDFYSKSTGGTLSISKVSPSGVGASRYSFNDSKLVTGNVLTTLSKELKLRINLSYLNDAFESQAQRQTTVNTLDPNDPTKVISYHRASENFDFNQLFKGVFTFENNGKNNYLTDIVTIEVGKKRNRADLLVDFDPVNQSVNSPSVSLQNSLSTLIPVGKTKFINLKSLVNFTHDKQNYFVDPVDSLSFPSASLNQYDALEQDYQNNSFYTTNSLSLSYSYKNWTFTPTYNLDYDNQNAASNLYGILQSKEKLSDQFLNDLTYQKLTNSAQLWVNYKATKWNFSLNIPVNWNHITLKDHIDNNDKNKSEVSFSPSLTTSYAINHMLTLRANARISTSYTPLSQLYNNYIFSGLNFSGYDNQIQDTKTSFTGVGIEFKNPFNGLFANLRTDYSLNQNKVIYGSTIDSNGQQIITASPLRNQNINQKVNLGLGKSFAALKGNLSANASIGKTRSEILLNNNLSDVDMTTTALSASVTNDYLSWFNFSYNVNYNQQKRESNRQNTKSYSSTHNLILSFIIAQKHSLFYKLDYQENVLAQTTYSNRFMDLGYRFKWDSKKIDFDLEWQNILNQRQYSQVIISDIQTSSTSFKLRPAQVMLSVRFTF